MNLQNYLPTNLHKLPFAAIITATSLMYTSSAAGDINPYLGADGTWVSISGTVDAVTADSFSLDYGPGSIIVEMDDGDRDADAYSLLTNDRVTVNGRIDRDFFEAASIEAGSVYVEKLGTYFYASALDEEDFMGWYNLPTAIGDVVVQGRVTAVDDSEFVLNHGTGTLRIGVDEMAYNPLDDEGYQRIDVGDVVRVNGDINTGFFDNEELEAQFIATLAE